MATSGNSNFVVTRDDIITRALRIVNAIGQLETPDPGAVTEAAMALNMLVKERQADGMQLWKMLTITGILTAGVASYNIGTGSTVNKEAPLKLLDAWLRNTAGGDAPITLFTKSQYHNYSSKATPGTPTQMFYQPPGATLSTGMVGTYFLLPVPTALDVTNSTLYMTGIFPIFDFDASTDNPDFPSFYYNALTWGLADQLSTEYGVPLSERGFIQNKAMMHLEMAKSMDIEEGSLFIQPTFDDGA